jgi:hypothetical protein
MEKLLGRNSRVPNISLRNSTIGLELSQSLTDKLSKLSRTVELASLLLAVKHHAYFQTRIDVEDLAMLFFTLSAIEQANVWNALAITLPPDEKRKIADVMNDAADPAFVDSISSDKEESQGDDTLVIMEEAEADASRSSSSSSSDSSDHSSTRITLEASLPAAAAAAEDSSSVGERDNRSLGSSDSILYSSESSVGNGDEGSSSAEESDNDKRPCTWHAFTGLS